MIKRSIYLLLLLVIYPCLGAEAVSGRQVRKVALKRDDIAQVRTAVGLATIIQVPDRPTSVVLGDTNAFKVEYLETAITIKLLGHSSKGNLYIYTESRRFNVSLVTTQQSTADYIVYLDSPRPPQGLSNAPPVDRWRDYRVDKRGGNLHLTIRRLGTMGDDLALEFSISSKKEINFGAEWIWITQNGKTIPIQGLNLSGVKITPTNAIQGGLILRREDLPNRKPIMMEVRSPSPISVKLPGAESWMK